MGGRYLTAAADGALSAPFRKVASPASDTSTTWGWASFGKTCLSDGHEAAPSGAAAKARKICATISAEQRA
jgi:hypothetical protein